MRHFGINLVLVLYEINKPTSEKKLACLFQIRKV